MEFLVVWLPLTPLPILSLFILALANGLIGMMDLPTELLSMSEPLYFELAPADATCSLS